MQTRSGKTYTIASSLEDNKQKPQPKIEINVDNRGTLATALLQPRQISNELAKFLGKPLGTRMLRTDVSRCINSYIARNKLQDPMNGRVINADKNLSKLLKLGKNDELTYFNIQRCLSHHFIRLT
jgi:chromatin remodeling complex protein RSC6